MRRYGIIHPLYMSFYSKALYQDVARNWKGYGLVYLLSLIALITIPYTLHVQSAISDLLSREAPNIIRQMPAVTITKGKLSIDRPVPYYIRDEKTGEVMIIFDTSGQITSLKGSKAVILVSADKVMVRTGNGEIKTLDLTDIDGFFADRRQLYQWTEALEDSIAPMIYPFVLFFSYLFYLLEAVLFTGLAAGLARYFNTSPGYSTLLRLSVVSLTPSTVTGAVLTLAGVVLPFWWLLSIPVTAAYLYFALRANIGREVPGMSAR